MNHRQTGVTMTSSATTTSTSKTLEPASTLDWDKALDTLDEKPSASLTDLLSAIDTYPAPAEAKKSRMPVANSLTDKQKDALQSLPEVFGKVQPPASRRLFNEKEKADLAAERNILDEILKFCAERKDLINEMIGTHMDVLAEKKDLVRDQTGVDDKGHYLIAAPGAPERDEIRDLPLAWTRQRQADKTVPSQKLLDLYHKDGHISAEDYKAVTGRVLDEEKVRQMVLKPGTREQAQRVLNLINEKRRGTNSIWLRKA
jgi:hypothetical protein